MHGVLPAGVLVDPGWFVQLDLGISAKAGKTYSRLDFVALKLHLEKHHGPGQAGMVEKA